MRNRLEETEFVLPFSGLNFLQIMCCLIISLNCLFMFIERGFCTLIAYKVKHLLIILRMFANTHWSSSFFSDSSKYLMYKIGIV